MYDMLLGYFEDSLEVIQGSIGMYLRYNGIEDVFKIKVFRKVCCVSDTKLNFQLVIQLRLVYVFLIFHFTISIPKHKGQKQTNLVLFTKVARFNFWNLEWKS